MINVWYVKDSVASYLIATKDYVIAELEYGERHIDKDTARNYAQLMSSAPEMLEALRAVLEYLPARDGMGTGEPDGDAQLMIADKIKQAIGKAEGREG